jgi:KDO2-lipid IV(A) lauroyltransferase
LGYRIAVVAGWIYGLLAADTRAIVRSNLVPVLPTATRSRLRRCVLRTFRAAARSYYEAFYLPYVPPGRIVAMVRFEPLGWSQLAAAHREGRGLVVVFPHLSSYDLAMQAVAARGLKGLVLLLPDSAEGFELLNQVRRFQSGADFHPTGPAALRQAVRTLRRGEVVATGAERPIKGQGQRVEFFGRPTLLPDGHVRLALRTGAAFFLVACRWERGRYHAGVQRIGLARTGDDETDVCQGVQRLARAMEPHIRAHPDQWHLQFRLWE